MRFMQMLNRAICAGFEKLFVTDNIREYLVIPISRYFGNGILSRDGTLFIVPHILAMDRAKSTELTTDLRRGAVYRLSKLYPEDYKHTAEATSTMETDVTRRVPASAAYTTFLLFALYP